MSGSRPEPLLGRQSLRRADCPRNLSGSPEIEPKAFATRWLVASSEEFELSMQTRGEQMLALRRARLAASPPFLRGGFRPFFFGGAAWAVLALLLWLAALSGAIALPSAMDSLAWHRHEMLFGFVGAVICGFLLTAIPNWTGRLADRGHATRGLVHALACRAPRASVLGRFRHCDRLCARRRILHSSRGPVRSRSGLGREPQSANCRPGAPVRYRQRARLCGRGRDPE